jgi:hypothetical protein
MEQAYSSGNVSDLHFNGAGFEPQLGYRLSSDFYVTYLSPSKNILGQYN